VNTDLTKEILGMNEDIRLNNDAIAEGNQKLQDQAKKEENHQCKFMDQVREVEAELEESKREVNHKQSNIIDLGKEIQDKDTRVQDLELQLNTYVLLTKYLMEKWDRIDKRKEDMEVTEIMVKKFAQGLTVEEWNQLADFVECELDESDVRLMDIIKDR
jgi:predicted RNase H-like nuclease (RuvC/YqgF family)